MTRTFSLLFLFLFLASCGGGGGGGNGASSSQMDANEVDNATQVTDEDAATDPAPTLAQTFDVNARLTGFSAANEDKVQKAIELIKKVVASDKFKSRVLNFKYNGKKRFVDNNGLTNAQIYQKILEGAEKLSPEANNTMDVQLQTYYVDANVIGYTMANIKTIYMNRKYLSSSSFPAYKVAMNMTHEWLHKLGFGHDSEATASRPYSVPYGVGYIMRDLAKTIDS
ncbi:hypothetical protein ACJVC5_13090 [Peredibacter sp. HCB2-198]|uniref:hypothetical protein n=1 Tax=Peredibacter sp. HCB2-198 TaxID=3383025 RepID=UPI0038B6826B